jgi:hypothetical protein
MPDFNLTKEINYIAKPMCISADLGGLTRFVHNQTLQHGLLVFEN